LTEKVELKARINELLRQAVEESKRRDVENAELKARIEELEQILQPRMLGMMMKLLS
jgi:DNA replication initiation complex subunit (GINS family)